MASAMTPAEFAKQMQQIYDDIGDDSEAAHREMDELMCRVLIRVGYREGVAIFDKQKKYYA
jgi:hypothetical protein